MGLAAPAEGLWVPEGCQDMAGSMRRAGAVCPRRLDVLCRQVGWPAQRGTSGPLPVHGWGSCSMQMPQQGGTLSYNRGVFVWFWTVNITQLYLYNAIMWDAVYGFKIEWGLNLASFFFSPIDFAEIVLFERLLTLEFTGFCAAWSHCCCLTLSPPFPPDVCYCNWRRDIKS